MKLWETLAAATTPDGGRFELRRHDGNYVIQADGYDLMTSYEHGSEDAMMSLACPRPREDACILIGGLGMGYTLAATLDLLPPGGSVVVSELVPEVVEWNRGPLGEHAGHPLRDERVTVHEVDVAVMLRAEVRAFDAILLDVDNGPDGLTQEANNWLYSRAGLNASYEALRPKGVLAVWSAGPDRAFTKRLRKAGFEVEEVTVWAHRGKGARHLIWVARIPA